MIQCWTEIAVRILRHLENQCSFAPPMPLTKSFPAAATNLASPAEAATTLLGYDSNHAIARYLI